jgi:hypothetical protein
MYRLCSAYKVDVEDDECCSTSSPDVQAAASFAFSEATEAKFQRLSLNSQRLRCPARMKEGFGHRLRGKDRRCRTSR